MRGFLQRVVLADYALSKEASLVPPAVWRGMISKLADFMLKRRAPTPQTELDCLRDEDHCDGFSLAAPRMATRALIPASAGAPADATSTLAEVLQRKSEPNRTLGSGSAAPGAPAPSSPSPGAAAPRDDEKAFFDFLTQEMDRKGVGSAPALGSAPARSRSIQGGAPAQAPSSGAFQSIADYLQSGRSTFSRYFKWAEVLADYRANIAHTYLSLYDANKTRLALATPALVDYNFWLQDQSPSPIADQIEVMALLSLRLPKPVHGFAPFDPLREVRRSPSETSSLQIAQNAILNRGFLGVKIYSPMGFRPSGNAEQGLMFPAYAAMADRSFGAKLDEALDRLYAWCEAEEVPMLAHTTDSQSAGPDFASRAEPKFWEAVLLKYPKLKVNLAHFGNFTQAFNGSRNPHTAFELTWEREIGEFVKGGRFPNVYADISYFFWVLEGSKDTAKIQAAKAMFKRYIAAYDPKVERLMFGTDWNMTGKAEGFEHYLDKVEVFFRDLGLNKTQLDNLFYNNAARFLGLKGPTKAMARLGKFYKENGKTPPVFA